MYLFECKITKKEAPIQLFCKKNANSTLHKGIKKYKNNKLCKEKALYLKNILYFCIV